ncbi:MAG TPA: hypothetical protein VG347_01330 [Verrucomicrobiae bacterium]|nr:hypothetical protein [Verrucomicrobiae bacterium]
MKKITALVLFTILAAFGARADVLMQDTFNYTNGTTADISTNVVGGVLVTNWAVHSGSDDSFINKHRLEVSSSSTYLGVTATRSGDIHRFITNSVHAGTSHEQLYASFIVNFTNLPTAAGAYFAHFYVNSSTFPCRFWALTNGTVLPNTFRMGIQMGSVAVPNQIFPVDLALNTDYKVVMGYDPAGLDAATIWINPINASDVNLVTSDAYAPGTSYVVGFAFRQASGFGGFCTVSNLAVATTFDEAATNTLATNAVPPVIVYQPVVGQTNFPTAVLTISAVANGQGLGSMTYQWQVASSTNAGQLVSPSNVTDGGDISGSATSILSFSSAVVGDSGYYALIATTPYGLSVTSSPSKFAIVDGPYPPVITAQPAATVSGYQGYPVSVTVSAASPPSGGPVASGGPVEFIWYSNNVIISSSANNNGAQTDSGLTSTYGFSSSLISESASYKVAVTNLNGAITSSVSVVSIIVPPTVTVAFLRTLVDPNNNYQATNSKIAYQVTGTITTATNITSGNTASYYLQDATAGIDIFATFGSTFRPAQGDVVTFVGVMSSFSSGLELVADPVAGDSSSSIPYTSYTDTGVNVPLPAPQVIPFNVTNSVGYAAMNTTIAGRYVQLTNVFFGTNAGTPILTGFYTVTNKSGQPINLWFSAQDLDTYSNVFPAFAYSVTGVMFGSMNPSVPVNGTPNPNFAVAVTKFADINTNVGVTPASSSLCIGSGTTLTATTAITDPVNYSWSPGGATTASIVVAPSTTTTYTVSVSNSDNSILLGSALATVTINPLPVTQTIRATAASICSNSPTIISLAGSVTGTTYFLQTNATFGTGTQFGRTNGTGSAVTFTNVFPKVSVTYYVVATNGPGCPLTLGSTNITVIPLPLTSVITGAATASTNQSGVAYSVSSTAGSTYGWTVPAGATFTGGPGSAITVTFGTASGNVTVTETNTTGCIGVAITKPVTVVIPLSTGVSTFSGSSLTYTGGVGSRFILLSSPDLRVLPNLWARVLTNTTTPGSFAIPAVPGATNLFFRVKSE